MKISVRGRYKKCQELRKWHKKFVFFPRQIDNNYYFLCYLMRMYRSSDNYYAFGRLSNYKYKDIQTYITEKLKGN